jgi:pyruvate dehydrogenase E2 component (dihydrolipoamide acetyltransferase)
MIKVVMEALSPTMEEGRIVQWLKHEGDAVNKGDVLAEVETDKAIMELPARGDGVLRAILVKDGETTDVGNVVGVIAGAEEDISAVVSGGPARQRAQAPDESRTEERPVHPAPASPAPPAPVVSAEKETASSVGDGERIKASPLARRLAEERSIPLSAVTGSGPGGRITKRDVESVGTIETTATVASAVPPVRRSAEDWGGEGWKDVPLTQLRKTIARRLTQSLGPVPHFFLTTEIDMERAAEARDALNALGGDKISFNDILVKVVATALVQHPECNAWWQDTHIRYFRDVHLGIAVAVDEGLITPVIRQAQDKTLRQIAVESRELAERARARRLAPEEYTGGTFSISNLGMFGIDEFTAVINPPEAGILAVGAITEHPVFEHGVVVGRKRMRVTMSCDHRVIDGATGARFLQTVKRMLENPLAIVW